MAIFLWSSAPPPYISLEAGAVRQDGDLPLSFDLDLNQGSSTFPLPKIEGDMTFSFDPPLPDVSLESPPLFVRLKKNAQSKRVALPSRIDLQFENGLVFSNTPSSFWVELRLLEDLQIEGNVFVSTAAEKSIAAGCFAVQPQESPIQLPQEFPDGSPFRVLAEARWWGHDLFKEKYGGGALAERIEVGPMASADLLVLEKGDWISWKEGKWQKIGDLAEGKNRPIARMESSRVDKSIVFEGWDLDGHIRLSLSPGQPIALKAKGEELFSAIRIRSEKQISCMLEKQCLILKAGDWVFKGETRWKVLRKKEEKDAYLNGKLVGELFLFDRIESKGGQKVIQGNLFNPDKSQVVPVEIAVNGQRKNLRSNEPSWLKKGKGKGK
jgi:hypothetical protein